MTTVTATRTAAHVVDAVKVYGSGDTAVRALDRVSVGFPAGRFTAIMGPSGSGKSTLMHCAAGLDTLTSGSAFIGDTELTGLDDRRLTLLRRDRIGFVFQAFNLVPTLTVAENITLPLDLAGAEGDREWIDGLIDVVGLRDRLGVGARRRLRHHGRAGPGRLPRLGSGQIVERVRHRLRVRPATRAARGG